MEIASGIHMVDGVNANCYVIGDDELTVIDAGMPNNAKTILAYIKQMGRTPQDVKLIAVTHGHIDHIGSLAELKKATGAKVAAHRDEAEFIAGKPMPLAKGNLAPLLKALSSVMKIQPVLVDVLLEEGSDVAGFRVLHTPGHTPGSIALIDEKRGIILIGDTLRVGSNGVQFSPGQFTWSPELYDKSVRRISALEFDIMLPGHGEPLSPKAAEKVREFLKSRSA